MNNVTMEKIVSLCKQRGFIFPGSDIYGGLANSWDYGPLGVELKNKIKSLWWQEFVRYREDVLGLDSAIITNPNVWEASGHLSGFSDPLLDCRNCKTRHRADKLIEDALTAKDKPIDAVPSLSTKELEALLIEEQVVCPQCGKQDFTAIRQFNLMFKTHMGVTEDSGAAVYLRPETAQGIFINFKNIITTSRKRLPLGIGQIGKSFRNEITPGNFTFRTREFEQMELEYFTSPDQAMESFTYWKDFCFSWLLKYNMNKDLLRMRDHAKEELAHYSIATSDIEFLFPFGWGELWGIAHRGDYDLSAHQTHSGKDMSYHDIAANKKYIPHVIEPSLGADRVTLAFLVSAYDEETIEQDTRTVLRLSPKLAPIELAILPLSKKLSEPAHKIVADLQTHFVCDFDESQSIGKRYRRQDEIGTPLCVTYDFDSQDDQAVTVRHRDTMVQERVALSQLVTYCTDKLNNF